MMMMEAGSMSGIPGLGFHDRWDAIEQDAECTSVLDDIVDVKVVGMTIPCESSWTWLTPLTILCS